MSDKRSIFRNTASQILVRLLTLGLALISTKLITVHLGLTGTGEYNTISTYLALFIVVADFGFFSTTVRELAKHPDRERQILSNVLTIRAVSALAASVVAALLVLATGYGPELKLGIAVSVGFIFFNLLASVYDMVFQTRYAMPYSAAAEGFSKLCTVVLLYFLLIRGDGLVPLAATFTFNGLLLLILKWYFCRRMATVSPAYDRETALWIIRASAPLGIVFILNNIFFKVDTLILFGIKGADAVGVYSVAYKVLEVTMFAGSYFASSLKPVLARQVSGEPAVIGRTINKGLQVMLLVALPVSLVSALFSRSIILFLSSPAFLSGATALLILSATLPLIYLDILLGELLIALDARKLLIRIALSMLVFNVILNLVLIPYYSFLGAAVVTVVSELVLLAINLYYTRRLLGYRIDLGPLARLAGVTVLSAAGGYMLSTSGLPFLISLVLTLLTYAGLAMAAGLVTPGEIREMI